MYRHLDGKLIRQIKNTDWHQALHMNLDSETMPNCFGLPQEKELPATFCVDYVRSWQRKGKPKSRCGAIAQPARNAL